MIYAKTLGKYIRKLRKEHHFSQEQFANVSHIHRTYIGMIERGEKNITVKTLIKIAKGLHTKAWKILKGVKM